MGQNKDKYKGLHRARRREPAFRPYPANVCPGRHCNGFHSGPEQMVFRLHRDLTFREKALAAASAEEHLTDEQMLRMLNTLTAPRADAGFGVPAQRRPLW